MRAHFSVLVLSSCASVRRHLHCDGHTSPPGQQWDHRGHRVHRRISTLDPGRATAGGTPHPCDFGSFDPALGTLRVAVVFVGSARAGGGHNHQQGGIVTRARSHHSRGDPCSVPVPCLVLPMHAWFSPCVGPSGQAETGGWRVAAAPPVAYPSHAWY